MLYPYLFINGDIVPKEKALIPVYDLGIMRGLGLFDFFRVWDGVPVFVEDHIDRLMASIAGMHFHVPYSSTDWLEKIQELIQANRADKAGFRIVVTGGFSEDGYSMPDKCNIYMMQHFLPENDPVGFQQGVSLITSEYRRELPWVKTTNYIQSMLQQSPMRQAKAFEVLYHWQGAIMECSRCNIFFIDHQGVLHTPGEGILKGITRKQTLAICSQHDIPVRERPVMLNELPEMAGAFLTATTKGILPVTQIGGNTIGNGKVHPLCDRLQELFLDRMEQYIANARLAQMVL
jgi:D-alanine transaminase/branched-chain amino acid aminotransferase